MEVEKYPNYLIYEDGKVWSKITKRFMKGVKNNGYLYVRLNITKGSSVPNYVHRLVATAYLPNPDGYNEVHHKNGVRDDNRVTNLSWVSTMYNTQSINQDRIWGCVYKRPGRHSYIFELREMGVRYVMNFKTKNEAELYRDITKLFYTGLVC